jgi:hypothetical protein
MGYRSDVAYTIRCVHDHDKKNEHTFFTFLAEAKSKDEYKLALDEVTIDEKRLMINFSCESVKWYENFPDVKSHMALFALAESYGEEADSAMAGRYVEVGENIDDIKEESFGDYDYDWVCVERKINTDW